MENSIQHFMYEHGFKVFSFFLLLLITGIFFLIRNKKKEKLVNKEAKKKFGNSSEEKLFIPFPKELNSKDWILGTIFQPGSFLLNSKNYFEKKCDFGKIEYLESIIAHFSVYSKFTPGLEEIRSVKDFKGIIIKATLSKNIVDNSFQLSPLKTGKKVLTFVVICSLVFYFSLALVSTILLIEDPKTGGVFFAISFMLVMFNLVFQKIIFFPEIRRRTERINTSKNLYALLDNEQMKDYFSDQDLISYSDKSYAIKCFQYISTLQQSLSILNVGIYFYKNDLLLYLETNPMKRNVFKGLNSNNSTENIKQKMNEAEKIVRQILQICTQK